MSSIANTGSDFVPGFRGQCINIPSSRSPFVSAGPTLQPRGRGPATAAASSRSLRLLELQQEICEGVEVRDMEGRGEKMMKRVTARRSYHMETQPQDNLQAAAVSLNSSFRDVNSVTGDVIFTGPEARLQSMSSLSR